MPPIKEAATEFLSHKRIAVTGVSRNPGSHAANVVYTRLRERGYQVFAVNPNADKVEGDRAYHTLQSIPGGVEAVVIGTRPELADETMRECARSSGSSTSGCIEARAAAASRRQRPPSGESTESR